VITKQITKDVAAAPRSTNSHSRSEQPSLLETASTSLK